MVILANSANLVGRSFDGGPRSSLRAPLWDTAPSTISVLFCGPGCLLAVPAAFILVLATFVSCRLLVLIVFAVGSLTLAVPKIAAAALPILPVAAGLVLDIATSTTGAP